MEGGVSASDLAAVCALARRPWPFRRPRTAFEQLLDIHLAECADHATTTALYERALSERRADVAELAELRAALADYLKGEPK